MSKIEDQSYLGTPCQVRGDGSVPPELFWDVVEVFRCSSGNQSIAEVLRQVPQGTLRLNCQVTKIRQRRCKSFCVTLH